MLPISSAIAALMAIVVISYRQTVRAYPSGGGAYIVSKENLGTWAGARRRGRAAGRLHDDGRRLDRGRGLRDRVGVPGGQRPQGVRCRSGSSCSSRSRTCAGRASPARCSRSRRTGSSPSILAMIAIGMYQCIGGCPATAARRADRERGDGGHGDRALRGAQGRSPRARRRSPASRRSRTACRRSGARRRRTRRRRWRSWASSPITMFLGISCLATHIHGTVASDDRSVLAQIAYAVFGRRPRLLRRAVLHGGDPDPGREHGLPGLPEALVDPGARPVHAAAVREPRRPAGLLQRHRRARDRLRRS